MRIRDTYPDTEMLSSIEQELSYTWQSRKRSIVILRNNDDV